MRLIAFVSVALGLLFSTGSASSGTVEQWLVRMAHAEETLDYRGTLVRAAGHQIETMRIVHRVGPDGVRERIQALDGSPREVIRVGDQVRSLIPGERAVVVDPPLPPRLLRATFAAAALRNHDVYAASLGGSDRVAGRTARIIELRPRDDYRYGRRLWLDAQTGMLLRSVMFEPGGGPVEKLSFVDLELGARIEDEELDSDLMPGRATVREFVDPLAGVSVYRRPSWVPGALPQGFRLVSVGAAGSDYEHLLFSDGLANFSVYVESGESHPAGEQIEARGALHVYTGNTGGRMVTVVGEVPAATVSMVGQHLRPVSATEWRPSP